MYYGAKRGIGETYIHFAIEIVITAFEKLVVLHVKDQIQVSGRSAALAGVSFTAKRHLHTGIHACRDFNASFSRFAGASSAIAGNARACDNSSVTSAPRASLPLGHSADHRLLYELDLSLSLTLWAYRGIGSRLGSITAAGFAALHAGELDALLRAKHSLFKGQLQVKAKVVSAHNGTARSSAAHLLPKYRLKYVDERAIACEPSETFRLIYAIRAESIVTGLFRIIAQHLICGVDLFYSLRRVCVLTNIGVVLHCLFTVGALYCVPRRIAVNTKHLIIVP
jgi:hypothetical protein